MTPSVLVWDQKDHPPAAAGEVLCWRSYAHGDSISSVPRYLETHAQRLRQKYLAFIHDLGERKMAGKRVIDHLDLGDGFSFWWMTLLAEKSPLKSPRIYDCLRLIALEEMLEEMRVEKRIAVLILVSSDQALALTMRRLCQNLKMRFRWQVAGGSRRKWSVRRIYAALPQPLQGLLSLRHVMARWSLRELKKPPWFSGENAIFICSYFIHLNPTLCAQGHFHSGQWEGLPRFLHDSGRRTNWIQLFLFSAAVPDVATGVGWLRRCNDDARNQGCHAFLDSYLTLGMVWGVLKSWLWLIIVSRRLKGIQSTCLHGSAVWLWPLLRADWQSSLTGPVAVSNCLWLALFDAALADIPRQATGLYLCENQNWEKALLRAWRRYGHGRIIGVQHATVPFWHLYYFEDPRCLTSKRSCALPLPDRLAVNGAVAWKAFADAGYPVARLVEVEAVRYLHLSGMAAKRGPVSTRGGIVKSSAGELPVVRVLVLGDMIPPSMRHLLGLLEETMRRLPCGFELTFKPHPGYLVDLADYPDLKTGETKAALGRILGAFDVAVAANSTSASVDAYLAGLPVIIGLDGDELNLSPLRGQPGARFVSTCEELAEALQTVRRGTVRPESHHEDFFFLDLDLSRWKRLLGSASPTCIEPRSATYT